jgi:hypothetical protein
MDVDDTLPLPRSSSSGDLKGRGCLTLVGRWTCDRDGPWLRSDGELKVEGYDRITDGAEGQRRAKTVAIQDEDGNALTAAEFTGTNEPKKTGMQALQRADLVNLLALPPPTRETDHDSATWDAAAKLSRRAGGAARGRGDELDQHGHRRHRHRGAARPHQHVGQPTSGKVRYSTTRMSNR